MSKHELAVDIVKTALVKNFGYSVKLEKDSVADLHVYKKECEQGFYAVVIVQDAKPYGKDNAYCYSFTSSFISTLIDFNNEYDHTTFLFVVDVNDGGIYCEDIGILEKRRVIDGLKFPFIEQGEKYYHEKQFTYNLPIEDNALDALNDSNNSTVDSKQIDSARAQYFDSLVTRLVNGEVINMTAELFNCFCRHEVQSITDGGEQFYMPQDYQASEDEVLSVVMDSLLPASSKFHRDKILVLSILDSNYWRDVD